VACMSGSEDSSDSGYAKKGESGVTPPDQPLWRRPIISLTVGFFVAVLLGIGIFLLADKHRGNIGTIQTPTSPTAPVTAPANP
jgi:hypothetical protein